MRRLDNDMILSWFTLLKVTDVQDTVCTLICMTAANMQAGIIQGSAAPPRVWAHCCRSPWPNCHVCTLP